MGQLETYQMSKIVWMGTPPKLDGSKPDFTVVSTTPHLTLGLQVDWQTVSAGFGMLYIYRGKDGKVHIDTENMSAEFVKAVLCKLVDEAVLE